MLSFACQGFWAGTQTHEQHVGGAPRGAADMLFPGGIQRVAPGGTSVARNAFGAETFPAASIVRCSIVCVP